MSERIQCQPWLVRNPQQFSLNFHTLPQSQRFFKTSTGITSIKTFTIGTSAATFKTKLQESSRNQGQHLDSDDPCGSPPNEPYSPPSFDSLAKTDSPPLITLSKLLLLSITCYSPHSPGQWSQREEHTLTRPPQLPQTAGIDGRRPCTSSREKGSTPGACRVTATGTS